MSSLRRKIQPDELTPEQLQQGIILFVDDAGEQFHCNIGDLEGMIQRLALAQYNWNRFSGLPTASSVEQDEKLEVRVLAWNSERLAYSQLFSMQDADGEEQTNAEGYIAAHLFDEYEMVNLFGHIRWTISFVLESSFQYRLYPSVEDMLLLMETLQGYLTTWQDQLAEKNEGPSEGEAAQAGRDTLLLTLRFLRPEWVEIDRDK